MRLRADRTERTGHHAWTKNRRGWGHIRQLPNKGKRCQANYVWPPMTTHRHNAPTTFSTRALAERWLSDERRIIEIGQWSPPKTRVHREVMRAQTFGEYATRWIEERPLKESSRREYRRMYASFMRDTLGSVQAREMLNNAKARAKAARVAAHAEGAYESTIADALGVDRMTIHRWLGKKK